jgi:hypothetical protein
VLVSLDGTTAMIELMLVKRSMLLLRQKVYIDGGSKLHAGHQRSGKNVHRSTNLEIPIIITLTSDNGHFVRSVVRRA